MGMYYPNKKESLTGFLSVYVIESYYGSDVVYKLHYFSFAFIYLKVRHFKYNNIYNETNPEISLMLPPAVRNNAPVNLIFQISNQ